VFPEILVTNHSTGAEKQKRAPSGTYGCGGGRSRDRASTGGRADSSQGFVMQPHQAEELAALWAASQSTVSAFIRTLVPDYQQADEVVQRVAVTLVRKYDQYDQCRPFAAWAIGVAKFEVLYYRRERATDRHLFGDDIVEQIASRYEALAEESDPLRDALKNCLDQVEGRSRHVIELRYKRGLSSAAIAAEMQLSSGAVRMLLSRVRDSLRRCIEGRLSRDKYAH
jgi:RNA polymerase sigma-70 factor (ECF subfamily)